MNRGIGGGQGKQGEGLGLCGRLPRGWKKNLPREVGGSEKILQ